jgi:hypothetical protein
MRTLVLGILTFVPSAYGAYFIVVVIAGFGGLFRPTWDSMCVLMLTAVFMGAWSIGLGVFYAHHLLHNERVPANKRTLWNAAILFGNLYAMPKYWYRYILHANDPSRDA